MACCLTASSHYLNQCWLTISEILWHPSEDTIGYDYMACMGYMDPDVLCPQKGRLTHSGLMTPYGGRDLGQHWFGWWLVAWRHHVITWTNVDLSSLRSSDVHLRPISLEISQPSVTKISLKIIFLRFYWNLPGANELNSITHSLTHGGQFHGNLLKISIDMSLEITNYTYQLHLPGANELTCRKLLPYVPSNPLRSAARAFCEILMYLSSVNSTLMFTNMLLLKWPICLRVLGIYFLANHPKFTVWYVTFVHRHIGVFLWCDLMGVGVKKEPLLMDFNSLAPGKCDSNFERITS